MPGTEIHTAVQYVDLPSDGEPFEVEASGSLMLIRRPVLDAVGDPWYGHANWRLSEDLYFCESAREAGYKIMIDPEVVVGHIGSYIVVPQMIDGVWGLKVDFGHGHSSFYPGGLKQANLGKLEAVA